MLRRLIDKEKFRTRATKDEPLALQSSVTVDDIVAEVGIESERYFSTC